LASLMTVEETKSYIQQHKYNPRYQIVWWMVAGLLQGETLVSFLELLQGAPVDLIGGYHHHLLAACLSESRNQLDSKSVVGLGNKLEQWLRLEMVANDDDYGGSAIEVLMNDLHDKDYRVRSTAVDALRKQLTLPESGLQALISALQHENGLVRYSAAEALGNQLTLPESGLQALIGALQGENGLLRYPAAEALGGQSTLPESALQAIIDALQDENKDVRWSAAKSLKEQSTLPESGLQALIGALQDEN
ncbi:hypothetical protein BGZ79_007557, partial [Entomortierella chlamydospora]